MSSDRDARINRANRIATELLADSLDISKVTAGDCIKQAREWLATNEPNLAQGINAFDLAMRAAYMYGLTKRLEN